MIITRLKGGLGNQMFQYACGRAVAMRQHTDLYLDTTALHKAEAIGNIYRPYSLEKFAIKATVAPQADIDRLKPRPSLIKKLRTRLWGDATMFFSPAIFSTPDDHYLDGYFQTPQYFNDIRTKLQSEFTLREPLTGTAQTLLTVVQQPNTVSLHVRRGDYVKDKRVTREFGVCSPRYYKSAIAFIEAQVANPTFIVFSDDIPWVKDNLPLPDKVVFVEGAELSDAVELTLMSQCHHNIIANSSFSWWGAWLNDHNDKMVVVPTPWFDRLPYDPTLIPETWIQLPK